MVMDRSVVLFCFFIRGIQTAASLGDHKIILCSFIACWISSANFVSEYKSLCRAQEIRSDRIQCLLFT